MPIITNFTWAQKELLNRCDGKYFMAAKPRKYNFAVPTENNIRLYFDPIVSEPEPIADCEYQAFIKSNYITFDNKIDPEFLPYGYDTDSYDMETRADDLEDWFNGKIVIFTPFYNLKFDGNSYKNMEIVEVINDNHDSKYFCPVPRINLDQKKFENLLKSGDYFEISNYDNKLYAGTDVVLCGDYAYRFKDRSTTEYFLSASELRHEAWKATDSNDIVKVKYTDFDGYKDFIVDVDDSISLIDDELLQLIVGSQQYIDINSAEQIEDEQPDESEAEELPEDEETFTEDTAKTVSDTLNKSEIAFIDGLRELTKANNLIYDYEDLVNFHTSIKTNPLTILSGMSGTGKTQLAYSYAKMLDISEDNNTLLFMPISPAYSEPNDVLGFLNPMTKEYVPSETGLVDFLIHASNNLNQMHMVIFDEMNLSQVEYWFSPFISILEKDKNDRFLKLYNENSIPKEIKDNDNASQQDKNVIKYPSKIKINENVIFVGTVNSDETTKDFSDRLLDRTFIVNLKPVGFSKLYDDLKESGNKESYKASKCGDASIFMSWNKRLDAKNAMAAFDDHKNELSFLEEFNSILSQSTKGIGISFRVLRNISYYLMNIPKNEESQLIYRKRAFDIVVNQTIVQKIRGTESQLQDLLLGNNPKIMNLLNEYKDISDFEIVKKSISKKAEDLLTNGYTN